MYEQSVAMRKKTKSHAFDKDVYLIGKDKHDDFIWLEAASWDCSWYWGFGYIEVYTNQLNPSCARDITGHSHWSGLLGKQDNGEYKHHVNEVLKQSVLTDRESWILSDYMQSFYTLSKSAELFKSGDSHLASTPDRNELKNIGMRNTINEVMLPNLFKSIYKILTP